ncbi:MAG: hypothetical protein AB4080_01935 [Trichodesmium sp.]
MQEVSLQLLKINVGHQSPWFDGLEKIFRDMKAWHPEADLFDLLGMKPQMWACHSLEFEWGQLSMLSFSRIYAQSGNLQTEIICLPQEKSKIPSQEILKSVGDGLKSLIGQDIEETVIEISGIMEGEIQSKPFTSTFIAIELICKEEGDRVEEAS